jgi:hypothetical protein
MKLLIYKVVIPPFEREIFLVYKALEGLEGLKSCRLVVWGAGVKLESSNEHELAVGLVTLPAALSSSNDIYIYVFFKNNTRGLCLKNLGTRLF